MAKKDCSELAQKINDLAMAVGSLSNVQTLDDVVKGMQTVIPGINRQMVVDSIVEATEGRSGDPDALANKINAIKQEARTDKTLTAKIEELEAFIEAGAIPATKTRRQQTPPEAIQILRDVRDGLKKQLAQSEPVRKARLNAQIADLNARLKSGDIYPKPKATLPQSKELDRLEFERDALKREIRNEIEALSPQTVFQKVVGIADISRDLTLSYDLGAVLRQGGFFLASKPITSAPAFKDMIEATKSEQGLARVDKAVSEHPDRVLFDKAEGFIAPTDGTHRPSKREEAHRSAWAEKHLPGVRMSNRAYVSFLNKMRIDVFSSLVNTLGKNGEVTLEQAKVLARFVNIATGRGELGKFSNIAEGLAIPFLAPRWVLSRFQLLGGAFTTPFKAIAGPKATRGAHRLIAKEYAKYMIGITLIAALIDMMGDIFDKDVQFELNPLSSDFGKARIGNTRVDILSGIGSVTVLLSRLSLGKLKSTTTKKITPIRPGRGVKELKSELKSLKKEIKTRITPERRKSIQFRIKEVRDILETKEVPFGGSTIPGTLGRFTRYKFSPLVKFPFDAIAGKNAVGEPVTLGSTALDFITPLALKDVVDSIKDQGLPTGTAISMAAILGASVNTYGFEVDIRKQTTAEIREQIEESIYKRTSKRLNKETGEREIRVKGQPHKGKEFKVEALQKELEKRQSKPAPQTQKEKDQAPLRKLLTAVGLGDMPIR